MWIVEQDGFPTWRTNHGIVVPALCSLLATVRVMDGVYDWGISVIEWLQRGSPALDGFFILVTLLGDELFLILVIPCVYWSVDRRSGVQIILIVLASVVVNSLTKSMLGQPRPFDYDSAVTTLVDSSGYGVPSGHSQTAVVLAGYGWWRWPHPLVRGVTIAMIIGVPLSRVYLGVHFPTDVIGGAVVAGAVLWAAYGVGPRAGAWFARLDFSPRLVLAILPGTLAMLVRPDEGGYSVGGAMIGLLTGIVLERRWVGFTVSGSLAMRLARYVVGMAVLAAAFWGMNALWVGAADWSEAIRYGIAAAWVALGAPWLFTISGRGTLTTV